MTLVIRRKVTRNRLRFLLEVVDRRRPSSTRYVAYVSTADEQVVECPGQDSPTRAEEAAVSTIVEWAASQAREKRKPRPRALRTRKTEAVEALLRVEPWLQTQAIGARCGWSNPTVHRLLSRMLENGMVVRGHASFGKSWTWALPGALPQEVAS